MSPDWPLVALAAWDVAPVVFSVLGFVVLARLAGGFDERAGLLVWTGTWLVGLGGLTKPAYKFLVALTGGMTAPPLLDQALFWLLAPGFLVAAGGLATAAAIDRDRTTRAGTVGRAAAVATIALGLGLLALVEGRAWFPALLAVATVGNVWVVVVLVRWSLRRDERRAAALFAANLVVVLGLAGAAATIPSTIPAQWVEQTAAALAQGLFWWGAVRLARRVPPPA